MVSVLIVIVVIGFSVTFYVHKQQKETKDIIKIGAVLPLTGIAHIHGQNVKDGIDLAVKEINNKGGINGKKMVVIYGDDNSNPKNTVTIVYKFIDVDNVDVIVGPVWAFLVNPVIPIIDKAKKVTISPAVLGDTINSSSPYFFSTFPPVAFKQDEVERFLEQFKNKRIGVIVVNNPWGLAHLDTYKKAILDTNNTLVKTIILPKFDNNDMSTELTLLKNLNLDSILMCLNNHDSVNFLKKVKELGIKAKILGNEHVGEIIDKKLLDRNVADGVYYIDYSLPSEEFINNFKDFYGKEPGLYSDTAYDTIYLIANVIKQYGTNQESIIQGLKNIKYNGVSGNISFNENNFPSNKEYRLILIENGTKIIK